MSHPIALIEIITDRLLCVKMREREKKKRTGKGDYLFQKVSGAKWFQHIVDMFFIDNINNS